MTDQDDRNDFMSLVGFNTGYAWSIDEDMRRILAAMQASPPTWWQRRSKKALRKYMTELLDGLGVAS